MTGAVGLACFLPELVWAVKRLSILQQSGDGEPHAVRSWGRSVLSHEVLAERHRADKTGGTRNLLDAPRRRFEEHPHAEQLGCFSFSNKLTRRPVPAVVR